MKNNGMLIVLLIYLAIFGVSVKPHPVEYKGIAVNCPKLKEPIIIAPKNIPIIDKSTLANKDYVVRVLVSHIKLQNEQIINANKQLSVMHATYTNCVN